MMQTERLEVISGRGRLGSRYAGLEYVIRVFQEFSENAPTRQYACGGLKLPQGDVAFAMLDDEPLELELEDGRMTRVLFKDLDGSFDVCGPIA
jgi:hypothetical protein